MIDSNKIICINCGESNQKNFYLARDRFHSFFKKIPYCKNCIKEIFNYYKNKYKNNNLALYYTCRKIDIPYIHTAYEGAISNIENPESKIKGEENIMSAYFKNLSFSDKNGWGNCFDDSQGENQIVGLATYEDFTKVKKKHNKNDNDSEKYDFIEYDTEELVSKWGNFPNEDLSYLESEYLDWEEKLNGITDKSTDIMVKEVCLQCNEIRKDRENGVNVEKKLKTLQDLLKTSGLVEKQDENSYDKSVGMLISEIEHRRPIKKIDSDFADIDSFNNIIYGFVGAMCRARGIENFYTEKFDEIYDKYSIDIIDKIKYENKNENSLEKDDTYE